MTFRFKSYNTLEIVKKVKETDGKLGRINCEHVDMNHVQTFKLFFLNLLAVYCEQVLA